MVLEDVITAILPDQQLLHQLERRLLNTIIVAGLHGLHLGYRRFRAKFNMGWIAAPRVVRNQDEQRRLRIQGQVRLAWRQQCQARYRIRGQYSNTNRALERRIRLKAASEEDIHVSTKG
ncbi:hypothetical protein PHYPSEUDO_002278 [Phytophthora pseudosyringae]|uniref:Uncharacterized protein n=1 Tax=Phytophthora pseudosyringae TaxID=221518 RepID=A0A8T1VXN2_9STRA|nr:hypothetical protein PHYPSEUDO_002278 [Phytophthora pseudosyringae]